MGFKIFSNLYKNMDYKKVMDKQHLVDLISNSLIYESQNLKSRESSSEIINYLNKLNLDQLRTMSKEFISINCLLANLADIGGIISDNNSKLVVFLFGSLNNSTLGLLLDIIKFIASRAEKLIPFLVKR